MPQLIVIAVIFSVFDEHVNDFSDPRKKHILEKKIMIDEHTVSLWNIHSKIGWHHELIF